MDFKKTFTLIAVMLVIVFLVNALSLYFTYSNTNRLLRKDQAITKLFESSNELRYLTFEYTQNPQPRVETQIMAKLKQLDEIFADYESCPNCKTMYEQLTLQRDNLKTIYEELIEATARSALPEAEQLLWQEMLAGQLMINSQDMINKMLSLSEHIREDLVQAQKTKDLLAFSILIVMFLLTLVILFYLYRRMVYSLNKINNAAAISATGNLKEGLVDIHSKDEIGLVADTYNKMVKELDKTYDFLNMEIERRRLAEKELIEINQTLEDRIAERTNQLENINNELKTFTYSVSHDLKAPLRGIDGYSRLLLEDHKDNLNEEGQHFLQSIKKAASNMNQLIDDLLTYSRLDQKVWTSKEIRLGDFIEELLFDYRDEYAALGGKFIIEVPNLIINSDRDGLALIIRNLIDNACKFSAKSDQPRVSIGARISGESLLFWISDNGIGFEMKYYDRIFGIFDRLHRQEDYPGTGIGLTMVKKAVTRMKGSIRAESTPGEGTVFYLEIPQRSEVTPDENQSVH